MSISFLDPQYPAKLPTRNEQLDFTITTDPQNFTASLRYASGYMETIYQAGVWGKDYSPSTLEGSTFHIRRVGAWPAGRFSLVMTEGEGGSGPTPGLSARLQPTAYSPLAQWALQGAGDATKTRLYQDRSGNGYDLDHGTPTPGTDLIVGQTAARPVIGTPTGNGKLQRRTVTPALIVNGEFTFTIRVKLDALGGSQQLGSLSSIYDATWASGTMWEHGIDPSGKYWYTCALTPVGLNYFSPSVLVCPVNTWFLSSLRRRADGSVRWGINLSYEDNTAQACPPQKSTGTYITIGSDGDSNNEVNGLIADACYWDKFLTDDEMLPLVNAAMGYT